jgi:hypothetical protein
VFLAAFREDGTVAWKRGIGGGGSPLPNSIARDSNDNFYIAGIYLGDAALGSIGFSGHGITTL